MTTLRDACADAATWVPEAAALLAEADSGGTVTGRQWWSRPPWNPAAAAAYLDPHEGLRRLEVSLRLAALGHAGRRRGGSDAATLAALDAIQALGEAVTTDAANSAARIIWRWVTAIRQLPAIDEEERWIRLRADAAGERPCCPYCLTPSLRVAVRAGLVACVLPGCCDGRGARPVATMELGAATGDPLLIWGDGLIQTAP